MTNKQLLAIAFALFTCGVITLGLFLMYEPKPPQRESLPILGDSPAFVLTDSTGTMLDAHEMRGRIWVASFIFTNCPGPCPTMSKNMSELHKSILDPRFHQVSFSVDPLNDSPPVLATYAKKFDADVSRWHFLTGSPEQILTVAIDGFKIGDPDNLIAHSTKFALVDRSGFIRGYYEGTDEVDVQRLAEDVKALIAASWPESDEKSNK